MGMRIPVGRKMKLFGFLETKISRRSWLCLNQWLMNGWPSTRSSGTSEALFARGQWTLPDVTGIRKLFWWICSSSGRWASWAVSTVTGNWPVETMVDTHWQCVFLSDLPQQAFKAATCPSRSGGTFSHLVGTITRISDLCLEALLQNAPHDSICGCGVDDVRREMEVRFVKVNQVGNCQTNETNGRVN